MERDDKRTINWLVRWLSVIWLAGTSLGAFIALPLAGLVGESRIEQQARANALQQLQYMTP